VEAKHEGNTHPLSGVHCIWLDQNFVGERKRTDNDVVGRTTWSLFSLLTEFVMDNICSTLWQCGLWCGGGQVHAFGTSEMLSLCMGPSFVFQCS